MSFAVRHCKSFVADIQAASLGALQFSFGVILPPNSDTVDLICECNPLHSTDGSDCSSSSESENESRLSSSRGAASSGGSKIPSARR